MNPDASSVEGAWLEWSLIPISFHLDSWLFDGEHGWLQYCPHDAKAILEKEWFLAECD